MTPQKLLMSYRVGLGRVGGEVAPKGLPVLLGLLSRDLYLAVVVAGALGGGLYAAGLS